MEMEARLSNLENLVNALINKINNDKFYSDADTTGVRQTSGEAQTMSSENESAILDEAEVIDENNNAILDIAEIIENLEERISALEGRD